MTTRTYIGQLIRGYFVAGGGETLGYFLVYRLGGRFSLRAYASSFGRENQTQESGHPYHAAML